ncbi:MAG: type II toxin-antitoxin system VapC family toxin [Betaproteobacteria bacterium]|nr:type II toxin-antitoxin system VapC family toxin [Betaproteobacteria bacterium]
MSAVLDTHVWVWWLTPRSALPPAEREALDAKAERQELFLAAISLWEAQVLHARGRLDLPVPFAEWLARATDDRMISVLPLDVEVVLALDALPGTFHGDPADRLIVATARAHAMPLATHDSTIRKSRVVRLWKP